MVHIMPSVDLHSPIGTRDSVDRLDICHAEAKSAELIPSAQANTATARRTV